MRRRFIYRKKNKSLIDIDNYLTIVALDYGLTVALSGNTVEYCVDGDGNWKTLSSNTNSERINKGQTLSFRGTLTPTSRTGIGTFKINKYCDLTGNCNSLLFGDNAVNNNSLSGKDYAFYKLFHECNVIKNVSSNFLPATTLADRCYSYMFSDCTSLTTAPQLPATTLASYCYTDMFYGCTFLTTTPELPATTLERGCYSAMFQYCRSLTTAPQLPATTLAENCYSAMFHFCSSLTTAPQLPATTLAQSCYQYMFSNCSSLTTAPKLPATTLVSQCYQNMFQGCTSLTTAPELPATTLTFNCYYYMFYGCSKLNYIKAMFTTTPSTSYTNSWVSGVASSGTFVKNTNATWNVTGTSGIPSGWSVQTVDPSIGGGGKDLINFYIDDQVEVIYSFTAEKGMTWEQWVNSEYSTYNNIIKDFKLFSMGSYYTVKCYHEYAGVYGDIYTTSGSTGQNIRHSEIIENDKIYYWY